MPLRKKKNKIEDNDQSSDTHISDVSKEKDKSVEKVDEQGININNENELENSTSESLETIIESETTPIENSISSEQVEEIDTSITAEEANAEINQLLLSIVSGFSEYFYTVATDIFGKRPENISFESVRSDRKIGTTGIQLVSVNFRCEFGKVQAGLAVKVYKQASELPPIIEKLNYLEERLKPYYSLGVSTAKIIFQRNQILVMEGITGESFRHSTVPISEKYRLAGKCLAALHGYEENAVNINHYRELEFATIENLPLGDEARNFLRSKFSVYPLEKYAVRSGAISFGDFHAGNLLYEINLYKSPLLMAHLIDPEFLQPDSRSDRFEDIANFFVNRAIHEYQLKGNLFQITRELKSFLAGYDEILAYKLSKLKNYYFETDTFNYHLALSIVLSILNLLSMEDVSNEYISSQMESRLKLAVLLLDSPSLITNKGILTELVQ